MGKSINFGTHLVEGQKAINLAKCYSKIAKVLVKKIGMASPYFGMPMNALRKWSFRPIETKEKSLYCFPELVNKFNP